MRLRSIILALLALTLAAACSGHPKETASAHTRFEALKKLAGDWVAAGKDGKPTDTVVSSIRVTAGGNTVQETLFPGTPHEMVTMHYLEGSDLVLTHYCVMGNQPHMRAASGGDSHRIAFEFSGGANIDPKSNDHMHQAELTIVDNDHFRAQRTPCHGGQLGDKEELNLVRKQ
jgi:hypothetical protein